jgi:hypothetical protein
MWESSGLAFRVLQQGFSNIVLITYGASLNYLINPPNNQWWRFITPMFVHLNVLHLLMNMWALWDGGRLVERIARRDGRFEGGVHGRRTSDDGSAIGGRSLPSGVSRGDREIAAATG